MQQVVDSAAGVANTRPIGQVGFPKVDVRKDIRQVRRFSRAEVVDAANGFAAAASFAGNRRPNETGDPSYKIECHKRDYQDTLTPNSPARISWAVAFLFRLFRV